MLLFAAGTQGFFIVRSRIYESVLLLIVCFTLFRPGFWMDMIYPPYESRSPAEVVEIAEQLPENGYIRLSVEGLSPLGDNVSKTVMLNLGPEGSGQERLAQAGLQVMTMGEQAQITSVDFGSEAERFGVNFGMQITEVLVVDESRPPKELMFIPALLILGLVYWLQRRRRNGGKLAATDTAKA